MLGEMSTDGKRLPNPRSWLLAALLISWTSACGGGDPGPRKPDVVLVVIDTLRADHLSCYGYPRATTPVLDRLSAGGARFADTTAQSSWTLPSMVSMISGRYLTAYRDFPDAEVPVMAETFRDAGYRTVGVVGNVLLRAESGFDRGFDHYDARPGTSPPGDDRVRARSIDELADVLWEPVDEALAGGDERDPLFLYLHPFDPHAPYTGDPALDEELPPSMAPQVQPIGWQEQALTTHGPAADGAGFGDELAALDRGRGLYDQDIRHTDDVLGDILDGLRSRGVLDHCIVAVVSDHGECLWERLAPMKPDKLREQRPATFFYQEHGAYLYQEAIATPFLLWGAGVPTVEVETPVENVDLFPTLLELCQVPARGELHGRSLVPLLDGTPPSAWKESVHSSVLYSTTIRDLATETKLIVPTEQGQRVGVPVELFRLGDDDLERAPVTDPAELARLEAAIRAWTARYPTHSTFGMKHDPEHERMMRDLGYTEAHTGD